MEVEKIILSEITQSQKNTYVMHSLIGGYYIRSSGKQAFSKNGAVSTGSQHVEEWKLVNSYLHAQSSSPSESRTSA